MNGHEGIARRTISCTELTPNRGGEQNRDGSAAPELT